MTKRKTFKKSSHNPLNRNRILSTALKMADKQGLDSISMRNIAQELGVKAMSLYKHVSNKDEILDGLVDIVISEVFVPTGNSNWAKQMKIRAKSAREIFLQHPWAPALFESRTNPSLAKLVYAEKILSILRNHDFTISKALQIFMTLDSYIYGFILQESNWQFDKKGELEVGSIEEKIANEEYLNFPILKELMDHFEKRKKKMSQKEMLNEEFEFGLDLILKSFQKK